MRVELVCDFVGRMSTPFRTALHRPTRKVLVSSEKHVFNGARAFNDTVSVLDMAGGMYNSCLTFLLEVY